MQLVTRFAVRLDNKNFKRGRAARWLSRAKRSAGDLVAVPESRALFAEHHEKALIPFRPQPCCHFAIAVLLVRRHHKEQDGGAAGWASHTSPTRTNMEQHVSDAYAFLAVMCLPLLVWVVSRPPLWSRIRAHFGPVAVRAWQQLVVSEPPDKAVLQRWAAVRLEELRGHLERVRLLILDDEHMTATRQVGNRMAHERLVRDVREAEEVLAAYGGVEPAFAPAVPTPLSTSRFAFSASANRSVTEVIEFGPTGRWL